MTALRTRLAHHALEVILLITCVILAFAAPQFLSVANLLNVLRSVAEIGIIAFGMTLAIVAGEIDLSVGSHVAFAGCLMAVLVRAGVSVPAAMLVTLACGGAIGSVIGALRAAFGVPSFITSLALLTVLRGVALQMTGGFPLTPFPKWYDFLGSGRVEGVPFAGLLFVVTCVFAWILKDLTPFGREIHAVGCNAEAARLSGVSVARVRVGVLALTGALAALSGILLSARMMSGNPTVAAGWELDVIAAVIVGGTSLTGGVGSVRGTLIGVVFIGVLVNGMRLLDIHEDVQLVVRGVLVLLAVLFTRWQRRAEGLE